MLCDPWELDRLVRQQTERIRHEYRACAPATEISGLRPGPVRLQRMVGLGLIRAGRRLAGVDPAAVGAPRPASSGRVIA